MHKLMPSTFIDSLLKREYKDDIKINTKIVNDRLKNAQNLYNKDLLSHYGCVNAVEFLNGGQFLASGGDDQRVLLWNVHEALQGVATPRVMRAQHVSNIFCLGFDSKNTRLFSSGNDEQVIIHDIQTGDPVDVFRHYNPVYGLSVDPTNDFVFASACDDGSISIYDIRRPASSGPFLLAKSSSPYHGVMYNPVEPRLLATANAKEGARLWDTRVPNRSVLAYGKTAGSADGSEVNGGSGGCMNVRWSGDGSRLLALRRRQPPVLYAVHAPTHVAQFDHPGYFNSCTMKSCCFAGYNDEFVLSGSDDFNLYMWKVPDLDQKGVWVRSAHMVLVGHRSIVNQVRFNPDNYLIASSGVEKIIKVWSPFPLPFCIGGLNKESAVNKRRKVFSHAEYLSLVYRGGQVIDHDYSQESTMEDPRMMAFFDSLVQREIECWTSDDSQSDDVQQAVLSSVLDRSFFSSSDPEGEPEEAEQEEADAERDEGEAEGRGEEEEEEEEEEEKEEESREDVHSPNPIIKLIARKRAQLMRLAKLRKELKLSSSSCSSCSNNTTTASVSANNTASSSSPANSDSNVNDNDNCAISKKKRLMRLRKRIRLAYEDSSDDEPLVSVAPFKVKRRSDENNDTRVPSTSATTKGGDTSTPSGSAEKYSKSSSTPSTSSAREGETPDSGIYMLSDEQTNGSFKKQRSNNSKRNYRKRILNSDSD